MKQTRLSSIVCLILCLFTLGLSAEESQPWLGIIPVSTNDNPTLQGVLIETVSADSSAAEMGLLAQDVITQVSGNGNTWAISSVSDLQTALNQLHANDQIMVSIKRADTQQTLQGVLKAKPLQDTLHINKSLTDDLAKLGALDNNPQSTAALALSLHGLSKTLDQLPEKINEAAREFKKVYPNGEFVIKVEISINSNAQQDAKQASDTTGSTATTETDPSNPSTATSPEQHSDATDHADENNSDTP